MKNLLILSLILACIVVQAQDKSKFMPTQISEVTVFMQGAQITRTGKVEIGQGKSTITIESLSPHLDEKSIQIKSTGAFTVLSVKRNFNYLNQVKKSEKADSLKQLISGFNKKILQSNARMEVLSEKRNLLNENRNLGGAATGATMIQLKQAMDFYEKELSAIKKEEININEMIEDWINQQSKLQMQINGIDMKKDLPTSEIQITIDAFEKTTGNFTITYMVANTGWYPKYDIRVKTVKEPIQLSYKAEVFQNTGENWENVKLRFSNGDPNQSGLVPELNTWYLNYARNTVYNRSYQELSRQNIRGVSGKMTDENGEGLPGATVIVMGTTIGTVTDVEGNYSITLTNSATHLVASYIGYQTQEIPIDNSTININMTIDPSQLEEIVVTGYSESSDFGMMQGRVAGVSSSSYKSKESKKMVTTTIENQTTVEFEIEKPYTVKSNSEKLTVDLKEYQIETIYEYYAVPKLDKDAFLIARITNWDQYNLLEGEANLYFEDSYVGRSILDAKALVDTLDISLGRDKNIVLGRTKIDEFTKKKNIGAYKVESVGFEIIARNKKSLPIQLTIFDQIPVSAISEIEVSATDISGASLKSETGKLSWVINLAAQQQEKRHLKYEVKYPKREKVVLE